ncbi:Uncharacterized protein FWK35_00025143 [Aphis craccivora]|uniref:Uncharacterized protein n=1 Tax=Aphis craccivora TaxID=307492 RepID=A0A6G0YZA7_APHCR|nr:Uncharacterized protein FWK35_00025143 [Aphis craccivora]
MYIKNHFEKSKAVPIIALNDFVNILKEVMNVLILMIEPCFGYRKVNLVGTLRGQKVRKNPKKVTEKREILRKTSFRPYRFFYMVVNQKLITFKFLRNLSKMRKFARRLNFKFLRNSYFIDN